MPYEVTYGNQGELWYQEYCGERCIVFNDFEGQGTRSSGGKRAERGTPDPFIRPATITLRFLYRTHVLIIVVRGDPSTRPHLTYTNTV